VVSCQFSVVSWQDGGARRHEVGNLEPSYAPLPIADCRLPIANCQLPTGLETANWN